MPRKKTSRKTFGKGKLGSGSRFHKCVSTMRKRPDVYDPEGLCASIGRRAYGAKKMAAMARGGMRRNPAYQDAAVVGAQTAAEGRKSPGASEIDTILRMRLPQWDRMTIAAQRELRTAFRDGFRSAKQNPASPGTHEVSPASATAFDLGQGQRPNLVAESYAFYKNLQRGPYSVSITATDIQGPFTVMVMGPEFPADHQEFSTSEAAEFYGHHQLDEMCPVGGTIAESMPALSPIGEVVGNPAWPRITSWPEVQSGMSAAQWTIQSQKAGEYWASGLDDESGVANARLVSYGLSRWMREWSPSVKIPRGVTRAKMKKWFGVGYRWAKKRGNPAYGQVRGRDWMQETYETASRDAGKRTRQLKRLGYWARSSAMGPQVTPVGVVKMTLLHIAPGTSGDEYLENVPPPEGGVVRLGNPREYPDSEAEAALFFEKFHGRSATEIVSVPEDEHYHEYLGGIGELVEIKLKTKSGYHADLDFAGDNVMLASSEDGQQLYLVGGDQKVDLAALHLQGPKWRKDLMNLGQVRELTYRTDKSFDQHRTTDYFHKLSEVSKGPMPDLLYDTLNDRLTLAGGVYRIPLPLIGTSPGIVD